MLVADEAVSRRSTSRCRRRCWNCSTKSRSGSASRILFITHDLRVAAQICDDVAVMQHGRVVEQGPAAQVLTHPQEAYTRALLEAAPGRGWDFANFRPVSEGVAATVNSSIIPGRPKANPESRRLRTRPGRHRDYAWRIRSQ